MKIAVVYQGALGDTVLLASLLVSLRARWPTAERAVVTRRSFGSLMIKLGVAELAFDADDPNHSAWFGPDQTSTGYFEADCSLAWTNSDLLLSAVSSGHDVWAAHARRACRRAQMLFFEPRPPPHYSGHVTSFHRQELGVLRLLPPVLVGGRQNRHGPLLIQPGSGGREKCWPLENFMRLARAVNQAKIPAEFLLGEVELERFGHRDLGRLEKEFVVCRDIPLAQVADLLGASRAYLGNDSGISHLAAWIGVPVVVIFGPSNARQWRPVGPQVRVYQSGGNFGTAYGADEEFLQVLNLVLEVCG